jgi:hypothetical protein
MAGVMQTLRDDHVNMVKVLDAFERQLAIFERAETPDYDLMNGAIDYCLTYPDIYHHPKEDLLIARLSARDPAQRTVASEVQQEHRALREMTASTEFSAATSHCGVSAFPWASRGISASLFSAKCSRYAPLSKSRRSPSSRKGTCAKGCATVAPPPGARDGSARRWRARPSAENQKVRSRASGSLDSARDGPFELPGRKGFDEIAGRVDCSGAIHGGTVGMPCDEEDRHAEAILQFPRGLDPVGFAPQRDVHQYQVGSMLGSRPVGGVGRWRDAGHVIAQFRENRGGGERNQHLVLNDQDAERPSGGR